MAEGVGFEPTLGYYPKHAFQACALSHSAIPPARLARLVLRASGGHYNFASHSARTRRFDPGGTSDMVQFQHAGSAPIERKPGF